MESLNVTSEKSECEGTPPAPISFRDAFWVWVKVALNSFGGPAGQISVMHRYLVEEKRWISESRFLHALNYCMLLPGPEAQQLATYIGWLLHRTPGGIVAGTLFVIPGFLFMLLLSILYAGYHNLSLVQWLFFGLKPAVLAIVLEAALRIGRRALKNRTMVAFAAIAFAAIFFYDVPFPLIILSAAVAGFLGEIVIPKAFASKPATAVDKPDCGEAAVDAMLDSGSATHVRPSLLGSLRVLLFWSSLWFAPIIGVYFVLGSESVFFQQGIFFSQTAVVTFGGAYAVLAYVAQQAVESYGWLQPGEMLDGLGLAETTPGPLILVLQFVGFLGGYRNPGTLDPLLAGTLASIITVWVTFVPCFLWIFLGAPYIETLRGNRSLSTAMSSITAAVVGVVLNLAVWFALNTIFGSLRDANFLGANLQIPVIATINWPSVVISIVALLALFKFKIGMIYTIAGCALLGVTYHFLITIVGW